MNYLLKTLHILLIGSALYSQELDNNKNATRIALGMFDGSASHKEHIETALFKTINATRREGWDQQFYLIDNSRIDEILKIQKEYETLEDLYSNSIIMGQILAAKYVLYPIVDKSKDGYSISLSLIDIERALLVSKVTQFHELYDEDQRYPNVKNERIQVRFTLMIKELFNEANYDEPKLPLGRQCKGTTKKKARCRNKEPYSVINKAGYCHWHD